MTRLQSLRNPREFRRVLDAGRRGRSDGVTIFAAAADGPGRVGFVVPARVGGAVERNRMKRQLRAIVGPRVERAGHDLVVRVERGAERLSYQELENHVVRALTAAGRTS